MKRLLLLFTAILSFSTTTHAVLKEENLEQTLSVLRGELTEHYLELSSQADVRRSQNSLVLNQLIETMRRANQNALMLYSQKTDYVFDLTYACHEATGQYSDFKRTQQPFRQLMTSTHDEIAKYDSLIEVLASMPISTLKPATLTDRSVCLTLATSIRATLKEQLSYTTDYISYYQATEQRLKHLNDYADKRYSEIQRDIFINGGSTYLSILRNWSANWQAAKSIVKKKYSPTAEHSIAPLTPNRSQWSPVWIFGLFIAILAYVAIATLLNLIFFRFLMPRRLRTQDFLQKRIPVMMATTTITFALLMGLMISTSRQNFFIMASNLLVEYAWLLAATLLSLLLRVSGPQVQSAFRIYTPLLFVGLLVIVFRIILIPSELVNLTFPPIILLCMLWQWNVITRHNQNVPRSDMIYSYMSLTVFVASVACSWTGYTLLAVQILIWWIMQLTSILTITCIAGYVTRYGERHGLDSQPITHTWLYSLLRRVLLPVLAVASVLLSIYWAAEVFNLSDLCWQIFRKPFVNLENLQVSLIKLATVVCLWFLFSYVSSTVLALMSLHYHHNDPSTAQSRIVMGRNVVQVFVWGIWLILSLSILHVSVSWLIAISGGLSTGIGFASKDIIENIYYGASLMAGRVKIGDWIEVDGTMGKVTSISYTSTIVESLYGEVITFQNAQLFAKNYKNLTRNHLYVLAVIPFSVAYGTDLSLVVNIVETAVNDLRHPFADNTKPSKAVVSAMADSGVDFRLFVWADAVKKVYVVSDVLKCIYDTLAAHNIDIPFPQRDIHIKP